MKIWVLTILLTLSTNIMASEVKTVSENDRSKMSHLLLNIDYYVEGLEASVGQAFELCFSGVPLTSFEGLAANYFQCMAELELPAVVNDETSAEHADLTELLDQIGDFFYNLEPSSIGVDYGTCIARNYRNLGPIFSIEVVAYVEFICAKETISILQLSRPQVQAQRDALN